jgi:hypothetical protein
VNPDASVPADQQPTIVSKDVLIVLSAIIFVLALVALHANISSARRNKIENVIVTPMTTPSPSATAP